MAYLGKYETRTADFKVYTSSTATATHTLSWTPTSKQSLRITINGVVQQDDAFSLTGNTVTLDAAILSTDVLEIVGVNELGGQVLVPADGSIQAGKLASNSVTLAKLDTTGTASASTYLSGTMAWTAVAGTSVTTTKTTGTTTLLAADASGYVVVPCDSSGGNVVIKLPAAASSWSGSILHIVASAAPGAGYNVVIQNSAATELAQLNKKGDYYTVTCDSAGSNLVVIDHHQTYRGYLIATAQQDGAAHSLGTALMFNNPSNYTELENYGDWWDSANDKFTVPSGWVGSVELYANSGNASGSYLAVGVFKDGSQLIAPVLYSAASNSPFHWIESCTGTEEFQLKSYGTYTSGTKYAEAGLIFQWVGTRNA